MRQIDHFIVGDTPTSSNSSGRKHKIWNPSTGEVQAEVALGDAALLARAVMPELEAARGSIVNVTSIAGTKVHPFAGVAYAASKAGLAALTRELAHEFGRRGVRANAIAPRARTAMTADVFGDAPELAAGQVDGLSPDHVVTLVTFLSSPAAHAVNGQLFIVYGPTVTLVAAPTLGGPPQD